jgi:peroxiredoxin
MPSGTLTLATADGPQKVSADDYFKGKKVVLFSVPGAFTPTCSDHHLPGFVLRADDITAKGVDTIACVAVNDAWVMGAWGRALGTEDKVLMLADGNGEFTAEMGLPFDLSAVGFGTRSRRYAAILDDGVVTDLAVEEGRGVDVSSVDSVLAKL